ncbi:MAG: thioredoxin [Bacteroidales bacterium]|nr:thioredoxin [Bacteroidales bacterium]
MKKLLSGLAIVMLTVLGSRAADPVKTTTGTTGSVVYLTNETFKQQVFNYEINKEWKYAGTLPAIVDFYADWCGPCRMVSPVLEELAKEYQGRIIVYKVDTQKERLLSQNLGIQSLPTLLFIPVTGKPQVAMGALPKEMLVKAIQEVLLVK